MSVLEYRCYKPGDEREIVKLWNEALPLDPITLERFMNLVLLDGNFDPEGLRLAFAQGQLVGCATQCAVAAHGGNRFGTRKRLDSLFSLCRVRRQGIGRSSWNRYWRFYDQSQ